MARISALGLDIGRKRVGVAGCDGTGLIATGITTLERQSFDQLIADLRHICHDRQVEILVAGLPYMMDGSLGTQAKQVRKVARAIANVLALPLEYVDERLTSYQAEQLMLEQKISPAWHKDLIDRKAASLILQQWLDERRSQANRANPHNENAPF